jgi:hypothetical protein
MGNEALRTMLNRIYRARIVIIGMIDDADCEYTLHRRHYGTGKFIFTLVDWNGDSITDEGLIIRERTLTFTELNQLIIDTFKDENKKDESDTDKLTTAILGGDKMKIDVRFNQCGCGFMEMFNFNAYGQVVKCHDCSAKRTIKGSGEAEYFTEGLHINHVIDDCATTYKLRCTSNRNISFFNLINAETGRSFSYAGELGLGTTNMYVSPDELNKLIIDLFKYLEEPVEKKETHPEKYLMKKVSSLTLSYNEIYKTCFKQVEDDPALKLSHEKLLRGILGNNKINKLPIKLPTDLSSYCLEDALNCVEAAHNFHETTYKELWSLNVPEQIHTASATPVKTTATDEEDE